MAPRSTRQLLGLDLIRFAAAFMVMAFHLCDGTVFQGLAAAGWVGVEVFFVLSGFVIAYTAAGSSAGRFARSRLVRLMPGAWICASATAAMFLICGGRPDLGQRYLNALILWPTGPWVDGCYWTLPVEVVFYGVIFVTLALGAFRRIEAVAAALAIASTAYLCALLVALRLHLGVWHLPDGLMRLTLLPYGCYFALGIALWLTFFDRPTWGRMAIGAIATVGGAVQIVLACRTFSATAPIAVPEAVWLLAIAGIAASAWKADAITARIGAFAPLARRIGLATYPLYLLHDDLGLAISRALTRAWGHPTACVVLTMALCVLAALAVAAWMEPPLQNRLRSALAGAISSASPPKRLWGRGPEDEAAAP